MNLSAGQRLPLAELGVSERFVVTVNSSLAGTDYSAFGLQDGRLADDRYMVFYNQPESPDGAVRTSGTRFDFDLSRLASSITEIVLTATHDDTPLSRGSLIVNLGEASFDVTGALHAEKAAMLLRFYRRGEQWRVEAVGQGFDGGLAALVKHFGGEVAQDVQDVPTPPSPPVSLVKERQKVLLDKAAREQPQLVSLIKTAQVSLEKRGLADARYRVKLVLDISASMMNEYASGAVQALAERALALAARLDDDGEVDVYLFGIQAHRKGKLSLDNTRGFVQALRVQFEGGTHYGPVMTLVRDDARAEGRDLPTLVLFITDGGTSNPASVIKQMRDAANEPIFWKFMGIEQGYVNFDFLEKLDDLTGRRVDNADFFKVKAPIRLPDAELFDLLVNELDSWQRDARRAGVL
ncbi:VWA domain-containing protein [Deinococcus yavapaiensis]|uniref:Stress response protein SCP2 n=1 Tax=Deinococcus yavapaiensis KR-236 TaxID=694435 RepID=A0A318S4D1_9DEIO|nr:VWA domain-containing protein [Deinococcus yavapaiensis]PYE50002.1 stress response protein SCP2 [Deinococcus yavapaiensis KR-236]